MKFTNLQWELIELLGTAILLAILWPLTVFSTTLAEEAAKAIGRKWNG